MANNTADLKKFAQATRRQLREQVAGRLEQVLRTDSAELRQKEAAIAELRQLIAKTSKKAVIDRVAYTWFNRLCALRFMDANRYTRIGVVSTAEGFTQPEILQEAKQGYIDEDLARFVDRQAVFDLLSGKAPSSDGQQEAYRLLLVGVCNSYNAVMPFLFEKIEDYTELLMPLDLLSDHSILSGLRTVMTAEPCRDVEVIGWLYQYYISERKDEVFEALKQNQKIEAPDIPAATQLFTPHWIVRYLVENSLGRLWLLNRPASKLAEKMEYYVQPVEAETDFLKVASPEEIKICDPACGSGHMLTYAFDLLYAIYEEEGYPPTDIPGLILRNNLFGIEIDERAGALAAFTLFMKARGKDRRFLSREVQPNICVLENVTFTDQELDEYMNTVGRDLFAEPLLETLRQFEQADNFGSLIRPILTDVTYTRQALEGKNLGGNLFLYGIHERALKVLKQVEYLSPVYHVVVTNPPYISNGNLNEGLKEFSQNHFKYGKLNLFSMCIERNLSLLQEKCFLAMITLDGWMFRSAYEEFRRMISVKGNITSMSHFGPRAFDAIDGEVVSTTAFVIQLPPIKPIIGKYFRITGGDNEIEKDAILRKSIEDMRIGIGNNCFLVEAQDFLKIPGQPIIYWASKSIRDVFKNNKSLGQQIETREGLTTGNNEVFLRFWFELSMNDIFFGASSDSEAQNCMKKWYPYVKGGAFRRWSGNQEYVINWENDGKKLKEFIDPETNRVRSHNYNGEYAFKEGFTWSIISSGTFGVRFVPKGFMFDTASPMGFPKQECDVFEVIAFLNCSLSHTLMAMLAPMLDFKLGHVLNLPYISSLSPKIKAICKRNIMISKNDWDAFETSWDFRNLAIIKLHEPKDPLSVTYDKICTHWNQFTIEMKKNEEENNNIFIELYGLLDVLTPNVALKDITLKSNRYFRYANENDETNLESKLLSDTIKEFISYVVGCVFGRYSLNKPGLILTNQHETLQDYLRLIPDPSFMPEENNAIPILDGDWFNDDIVERFKKFLKVTFGEEHYEENLAFIEEAIGRDIRSYFLRDFYPHHLKMYQKRPIYWLFSSPRGSFNVLIYMHRYNKDTVSVILTLYLREFRVKLEARKGHLEQVGVSGAASPREKTAALKEIEKLNQTLEEIRVYERDILYPLAAQRIEIDLDDGVKVNYAKFGKALAPIK